MNTIFRISLIQLRITPPPPPPPGGYVLVMGYWGCAAGWGRIFTTGLTVAFGRERLPLTPPSYNGESPGSEVRVS